MLINGKDKDTNLNDLLISARTMGIKVHEARKIIDDVITSVKKWRIFASEAGLDVMHVDAIEKTFDFLRI